MSCSLMARSAGRYSLMATGMSRAMFQLKISDAEAAVAQDPVELEVLHPGALGQGQAVVGGGHDYVIKSGLDTGIIPGYGP